MSTFFKNKHKETTLKDIATEAGVSQMTVSRALRNPKILNSTTYSRVIKVINKVGYVPNNLARSLATHRTNAVAIILPILNQVFAPTYEGLREKLMIKNFDLMLGISNYSPDIEQDLVKTFLSRRVDAIVIMGGDNHTTKTIAMLNNYSSPIFQIWNLPKTVLGDVLGISHKKGAEDMVRYLWKTGNRNIGYIGGMTKNNDRTKDRLNGFLDQMLKFGKKIDKIHIEEAQNFLIEEGARCLKNLIERCPNLDAIFVGSDILAAGAIFEAQRKGIKIPENLVIVGFDDAEIARGILPSLTTVRVKAREMGERAGELILSRLDGYDNERITEEFTTEIIVRESG